MLDSLRIENIENGTGGLVMEDQEELQLRRARKRHDRARSRRRSRLAGTFFASPYSAIICMLVALGSIVAFWRGVPSWALLALGFGAVLIIGVAGFFYRSKKQ